MGDFTYKQIFLFFGTLAVVMGALIAGVIFFLPQRKAPEAAAPALSPAPSKSAMSTFIEPKDASLAPTIIYTGSAFSPDRVLRDNSDSIGCVVVLANQSRSQLRIAIAAENGAGTVGPDYAPIAPGDRLIFDPRFTGITALTYIRVGSPAQKFIVTLAPQCRL